MPSSVAPLRQRHLLQLRLSKLMTRKLNLCTSLRLTSSVRSRLQSTRTWSLISHLFSSLVRSRNPRREPSPSKIRTGPQGWHLKPMKWAMSLISSEKRETLRRTLQVLEERTLPAKMASRHAKSTQKCKLRINRLSRMFKQRQLSFQEPQKHAKKMQLRLKAVRLSKPMQKRSLRPGLRSVTRSASTWRKSWA